MGAWICGGMHKELTENSPKKAEILLAFNDIF